MLASAEEVLNKANADADANFEEAKKKKEGDEKMAENGPGYLKPVEKIQAVPFDMPNQIFEPPSAPPPTPRFQDKDEEDDDEDEQQQKETKMSFQDFLKIKKHKDLFEQGDESTWYKEPPEEEQDDGKGGSTGKGAFEEFNENGKQNAQEGQQHEGLLRSATRQEQQKAQQQSSQPSFGQMAADAYNSANGGGFSGSLRPPDRPSAPVVSETLVVPY